MVKNCTKALCTQVGAAHIHGRLGFGLVLPGSVEDIDGRRKKRGISIIIISETEARRLMERKAAQLSKTHLRNKNKAYLGTAEVNKGGGGTLNLLLLLMISGGERWPPDHGWNEVGWRVRWGWCHSGRRRPTAGNEGYEGKESKSICSGADCWTVGALPGIERLGGVLSTYPSGPGPWDEWDS